MFITASEPITRRDSPIKSQLELINDPSFTFLVTARKKKRTS